MASDYQSAAPGDDPVGFAPALSFSYLKGVYVEDLGWDGEGITGFANSGVTLRRQGYRIASASAAFQAYACECWDHADGSYKDCADNVVSPLGVTTLSATCKPAPGQSTYGYPPSCSTAPSADSRFTTSPGSAGPSGGGRTGSPRHTASPSFDGPTPRRDLQPWA